MLSGDIFKYSNGKRAIAFIFVAASVCLFSYLWRNYQLDDALIYLRYVKNFASGDGLVYNKGERFNGLTSPLFTYVILVFSVVSRNLQVLSVAISAFFLVMTALISGRLFARTRCGEVLTGVMIAGFGYFYSTFGMETTLFMALIAASLYAYKMESPFFVITLALLVTTRSEGIFLAAPMLLDCAFRARRMLRLDLCFYAAIIALAPFLFNVVYYGSFLPATGGAKIGQGKSGLWGSGWIFFHVRPLYDLFFSGEKFIAVVLFCGAVYGGLKSLSDRAGALSAVFTISLIGFYGGLNIPGYHWYYAPFFLFAIIFFCRGVEIFVGDLWRMGAPIKGIAAIVMVGGFLCTYFYFSSPMRPMVRQESYVRIGMWLKENTPERSSIAMVEVGTVGWYADRYIVDILGLTNKYNAEFVGNGDVYSWLGKYQPDYILAHVPRWAHEASSVSLEDRGMYLPMSNFNFSGFVLLKKSSNFTDDQIASMPATILASSQKL